MTDRLRAYQREDIRLIHEKFNGRALLAWDMGLGKTVAAMVYVRKFVPPGPVVVICPASVKAHWVAEAKKWAGLPGEVLEGRTPPPRNPTRRPKVWVLNWENIGTNRKRNTWLRFLRQLKPVLIVGDEIQRIKDCSTAAYKGFNSLCEGAPRIVATSGTPVENHAGEIWPICNILQPDACPSFTHWPVFAKRYTNRILRPWGWQCKGSKQEPKLNRLLTKHVMIRRKKEDVLNDLPPCVKAVVPFRLGKTARKEYQEAEADIIAWLRRTHGKRRANRARKAEQMVKLGYLKRLAATLRMPQSLEWVADKREGMGKVVLFGVGRALLQSCEDRFSGATVRIDGSVPTKDRSAIVERFIASTKKTVFIGNVRAAGVGMDGLQRAASNVVLLELDFNPAVIDQAFGRVDRFGQTDRVFAYVHTAEETVEVKLLDLLQKKSRMRSAILYGEPGGSNLDLFDLLEKELLSQ